MAIQTVTATINGQTYTLTYNGSSAKYEATLTAPATSSFNLSGGYYNVSVAATDSAGNTVTKDASDAGIGSSLRLVVKEKVKPTITIISPGASAKIISNKPTISFQLRDDDSGIKISTLALKIDSGSNIGNTATGMTCTPVSGGYDCTYTVQTALSDGSHTITVNIGDNDGNTATQASRTFTVDTVAPVLNVTSPTDNLITNSASCAVAGVTNDLTSSPVTVTIKLNNVDQGSVTVDGGTGAFSKTVTLVEGANTIIVTATDSAGKATSVSRSVTLKTSLPVIMQVEIIPNPADAGATYTIKAVVTD